MIRKERWFLNDLHHRFALKAFDYKKTLLKFIAVDQDTDYLARISCNMKNNRLGTKRNLSCQRARCFITSRAHFIIPYGKISRLNFRETVGFGYLRGIFRRGR